MLNKVDGDVITYKTKRNKLICHCCNPNGAFSAGVALNLRSYWPIVYEKYSEWYNETFFDDDLNTDLHFMMGQTQFVNVEDGVYVANMIGQASPGGITINDVYLPPVRWDCLRECFHYAKKFALEHDCEIVIPYLGCDLAGGKESDLLALINEVWHDIDVTLVRFKKK